MLIDGPWFLREVNRARLHPFSGLADFASALQAAPREFDRNKPEAKVKSVSQNQSGTDPDETAVCLTILASERIDGCRATKARSWKVLNGGASAPLTALTALQ
jgi:hypothetical protein